ncbi:hypothetical protein CBR_g31747 [Chara braunii]|uniref:Uncharacterized protein n=1 Tax=Chara braunii TaxID=69332 RepID=A0A388JY52_CHABU|nr:hypothetical protein CBR_g31747 [Chara braunii]|eukprot:GBG62730.1 hypothetical protein CBR_g31747 [Chara braunii]
MARFSSLVIATWLVLIAYVSVSADLAVGAPGNSLLDPSSFSYDVGAAGESLLDAIPTEDEEKNVERSGHRVTASEWASLLVTRWSAIPSVGGRDSLLPKRLLNALLWKAIDQVWENLQENETTTFLVRYHLELGDEALRVIKNVTGTGHGGSGGGCGGGATSGQFPMLTELSGCCVGYGHWFLTTTKCNARKMKLRSDIFPAVEGLPPQVKVDPAFLGKMLDAITNGQKPEDIVPEPVTLQVTIAEGVAPTPNLYNGLAYSIHKQLPVSSLAPFPPEIESRPSAFLHNSLNFLHASSLGFPTCV